MGLWLVRLGELVRHVQDLARYSELAPGADGSFPIDELRRRYPAVPPAERDAGVSATLAQSRKVLTKRQEQVLQLLPQGKPHNCIGRSLGISEGMAQIQLAAIFRALNVRKRSETVVAGQSLPQA